MIIRAGALIDGAFDGGLLTCGVGGSAVGCRGVAVGFSGRPVTIGGNPIGGSGRVFASDLSEVVADGVAIGGRLVTIGGCGVAVGCGLFPQYEQLLPVRLLLARRPFAQAGSFRPLGRRPVTKIGRP